MLIERTEKVNKRMIFKNIPLNSVSCTNQQLIANRSIDYVDIIVADVVVS